MRRSRLKAMSAKRRAANRVRLQTKMRLVEERGPWCEARLVMCEGLAVDAHEILARSAGGSITDDENILLLCRGCHRYVTEHPRDATELGLRRSRWGGDAA